MREAEKVFEAVHSSTVVVGVQKFNGEQETAVAKQINCARLIRNLTAKGQGKSWRNSQRRNGETRERERERERRRRKKKESPLTKSVSRRNRPTKTLLTHRRTPSPSTPLIGIKDYPWPSRAKRCEETMNFLDDRGIS